MVEGLQYRRGPSILQRIDVLLNGRPIEPGVLPQVVGNRRRVEVKPSTGTHR
jgi:hypothetical protein